jgi:hypothetical protein
MLNTDTLGEVCVCVCGGGGIRGYQLSPPWFFQELAPSFLEGSSLIIPFLPHVPSFLIPDYCQDYK